MYELGTQAGNNGVHFGDQSIVDGGDPYTVALWHKTAGASSARDQIVGKGNLGTDGWGLTANTGAGGLRLHHAGGANTFALTPALSTTYSYMMAYDGSGSGNATLWYNGGNEDADAFTTDPTNNTSPMSVGCDGTNTGVQNQSEGGQVGHVCFWQSARVLADAVKYNAGNVLPDFGNLVFWARGKASATEGVLGASGVALDPAVTGTVVGDGGYTADATIDAYYPIGVSDPMTFLIAEYWLPLIAGAKLLGSNLLYQPERETAKMWQYIQRVIGCQIPDMTHEELRMWLNRMTVRSFA